MHDKRLLERIRDYALNPDQERRGEADVPTLMASVLAHVRRILNTKAGSVLIDENYGLSDFTNLASSFASESVRDLQEEISSQIMKYEPRIKDVRVDFVEQREDVLSLRFKISGRFDLESRNTPVVFESVVQSDGKISITS